ncbi:MAG TPA: energy transducer TonB [Bacteroidia bacterium]|jgi:TonB family protein|nr:energy transducer TonB [Bacteroidia bacterium]
MKRFVFLLSFLSLSAYGLAQDTTIRIVKVRLPPKQRLIDTNAVVLPPLWEPDTPAQFPGGDLELAKYLRYHVVYPEKAKEDSVQGTVILKLTIGAGGKVGKISLVKSIGSGCDEAAMNAARSMPAWIGAHHKGKHVESEVYLPVVFSIQ